MRISDWSSDVCSSDLHQFGGLDPAIRLHRLRAIAAIFGAAAGLDAEQGAKLDFGGRMVGAVDRGCAKQQLGEREVEQLRDFSAGPEIGRASCRERVCQYV